MAEVLEALLVPLAPAGKSKPVSIPKPFDFVQGPFAQVSIHSWMRQECELSETLDYIVLS